MSTQGRTIIIILALFLALSVLMYFTSKMLLMESFFEVEKNEAKISLKRIQKSFVNYNQTLVSLTEDYATWDDTYDYVSFRNEGYIRRNFVAETFLLNHLCFVLITDSSGNILFGRSINPADSSFSDIPLEITEYIRPGRLLLSPDEKIYKISGLLDLGGKVYFVSSVKIRHSDARGKSNGCLIMGRCISQKDIASLSGIFSYNLNLYSFIPKSDIKGRWDFSDTVGTAELTKIRPLDETHLKAEIILKDIFRRPVATLSAELTREIYKQGKHTWFYLISFFIFTVIVFSCAVILFLNRMILSRLNHIMVSVNRIRNGSHDIRSIVIPGNDEFSMLSGEINKLLNEKNSYESFLQQMNEELEDKVKQRTADLEEKVAQITKMDMELMKNYEQLKSIYKLSDTVSRAAELENIYSEAVNAVQHSVNADRASVLLFDDDDVMRFKAWKGISDNYRKAAEGHSPWKKGDKNISPVLIENVETDNSLGKLKSVIMEEGIKALGFVPLVCYGNLLGKFMVYYDTPHVFSEHDIEMLKIIAEHISFAIERKKSEEAIRQSEKDYRGLFENAHDAIIIFTPEEGIIKDANGHACEIYGYSRQELIGMPVKSLSLNHGLLGEMVKTTINEGGVHHFETVHQRKNRTEIFIEINAALIKYQGDFAILSVNRDITQRKRAELINSTLYQISKSINSTKDTAELYDSIYRAVSRVIDTTNFFIALYDEESRIISFPYFRDEMDDTTPVIDADDDSSLTAEVIRKGRSIFIGPEDLAERFKNQSAVGTMAKVWLGVPLIVKNQVTGAVCVQSYTNGNLYSEKDVYVMEAISEQIALAIISKRSEEELIQAKEMAEKSDKLKSEFLAQMSHEIRTPINTILSFTSLLKENLEEKIDDDLKPSFEIIELGGRRLIRTIDLILNMSQIQTGSLELHPAPIDLEKDVVAPLVTEFKQLAKQKELDLTFSSGLNKTRLYADRYTITQAFSQIIDNAIKYTPYGGVEIKLYPDSQNNICAAIKDTGIGISETYMRNLFTPFSQEETGYTRRYEGNGLGLAIAKKYCEMNNAEIKVESSKGIGSVFTLVFKSFAGN